MRPRIPILALAAGLLVAGAQAGADAPPAGAQGEVTLSAGQLQINQRISQAALRRADRVEAHLDGREASGPPPSSGEARFTLSVAQLRINQRIAQAAVRRVNALTARAENRPEPRNEPGEGSGSARFTLSRAQLLINQRITQAAVRRVNTLRERLDLDATPRDCAEPMPVGGGPDEIDLRVVYGDLDCAGARKVASRYDSDRSSGAIGPEGGNALHKRYADGWECHTPLAGSFPIVLECRDAYAKIVGVARTD